MNSSIVRFEFSFDGQIADDHQIDFYDVAHALVGFQRTLAITTHLILNGSVITQAPSLKGAQIIALPPEEGSWKAVAIVVTAIAAGTFKVTTAPRDTPLGNLVSSAYDYVISESLGFHVDYETTLGQQYDALPKNQKEALPQLDQSRFDSVIEKCEPAIIQMHRPISHSESALNAHIFSIVGKNRVPLGQPLDLETYEHISVNVPSERPQTFSGKISSYNVNTYKGRVFTHEYNRPIPFELAEDARKPRAIRAITNSLSKNALNRDDDSGYVVFNAFVNSGSSGRVKSFKMLDVKVLRE